MPLVDRNVEEFTNELIASTDCNRWDFIKIMSNGHFYTEAFGGEVQFSTTFNKWNGTISRYPIHSAEDARKLPVLGIDNPVWQRETQVLRNLKEHYGDKLPILPTLFTPLTAVQDCIASLNPAPVIQLMQEAPDALHSALEAVTQSNINYLESVLEAGADGIFIANQHAAGNILSNAQYEEFCLPYEMRIMECCKGRTWLNIAHIHGVSNLRIDRYLQYGDDILQVVNWENCPGSLSAEEATTIAEVRAKTTKVIAAGIDHLHDFTSAGGDRKVIKGVLEKRYRQAKSENGGNRFIFSPGCVLPTGGSPLNSLICEVAEELGKSDM